MKFKLLSICFLCVSSSLLAEDYKPELFQSFKLVYEDEVLPGIQWVGAFGSGTEIGGGFNWFVLKGKSNLRYTLDLAQLDSSPADQNRTGFVSGQSGYLIRTQVNSSF